MRYALLASLAAVLLHAVRVEAQEIPSPYRYIESTQSISAFAGWLVTDQGDLNTAPHSAPLFGGLYTLRFTGPVSGEVSFAAAPGTRTVQQRTSSDTDTTVVVAPVDDVASLVLTAQAGLRFHLAGPRTWHGLSPFLAASGGLAFDARGTTELEEAIEEEQRVDFGPSFAVGIGAGTDWFLTERLSLRLEARDHLWRLTQPAGLTRTRQEETEWTHNLGVTLGAAVHF